MLVTELKKKEQKIIKIIDKREMCFACEIFI